MTTKMTTAYENKVCCFCKKDAGRYGNNPEPVMGTPSKCCDECNIKVVLPARFSMTLRRFNAKRKAGETKAVYVPAELKDEGINNFEFNITDEFADILAEMEEDQKALLDKPSGLTQVLLCSNYWDKKYRQVDFTGTTNEEAIKKILRFYKHKTYRRLVGDHTFFEGIGTRGEDNKISLGS